MVGTLRPTLQILKDYQGRLSLHRHCERSEAIHGPCVGGMDCFVALLLAMTNREIEPYDFPATMHPESR